MAHDRLGHLESVDLSRERIEFITGDILDWKHISAIMERTRCSYVVHLAAIVASYANAHPREAVHTNIAGVANICEAARTAGYRGIVYVSSRSVYGNVGQPYAHPHYRRVSEKHPCEPQVLYPATKRAAEMVIERYAAAYGLRAVMLRFGAIYGPGKSGSHGVTRAFSEAIEAAARGEAYGIGGADQLEDFVYSDDIPSAISAGLRFLQDTAPHPEAQVFNIGSGRGVSVREFGEILERITGTPVDLLPGIGVMGRNPRQSFVMNDRRAKRVLRYRPRFDLESGIAHYVAALRKQAT